MSILIIFAHPSKKSYTHAVLQMLLEDLSKNHEVVGSDLYENGFHTNMSESEYDARVLEILIVPFHKMSSWSTLDLKRPTMLFFCIPCGGATVRRN